STDIAVLRHGRPSYSTDSSIGGFPNIVPSIDVEAIGAGGGSLAEVDASGVLKVGPHSAGAYPGPASYGNGSEQATLTDAFVVNGILGGSSLAAGKIDIDREAALAVIGRE